MAIDIRKPASLALGAALIGGMAAPAFAMTDLAQGYALGASVQTPPTAEAQATTATEQNADAAAKQKAEGKCGEGKCGVDKDKPKTDATKTEGEAAATADKAKAEGKCGEGKCGGKH
ncbi:HvfA family oxazolone/thioamide-modified RiPP metallophore [Stenotrophomonas pigmentata]|uniref:HvfA family oxazolone/thioamide-modified RiPP metallophore n=1 Tax=Stenotrophomonas pigmentata TaxID=3055080 RepID=UPI0026E9E00B|nr:hypothetical protein [Stenotrophomonas sp. 610A2]